MRKVLLASICGISLCASVSWSPVSAARVFVPPTAVAGSQKAVTLVDGYRHYHGYYPRRPLAYRAPRPYYASPAYYPPRAYYAAPAYYAPPVVYYPPPVVVYPPPVVYGGYQAPTPYAYQAGPYPGYYGYDRPYLRGW
jgi:hypothetical protein